MIGYSRFRAASAAVLACVGLAVLAGCGSDSDGAAPGQGLTQAGPSTGAGTPSNPGGSASTASVAVVVSNAVPASGNATVSGATATSTLVASTTRSLVAEGTGGGLVHRFTVRYDGVTGIVLQVVHEWGASTSAFDALVACVRTVTQIGQVACSGVSLDVANSRATFTGLALAGTNGTFRSILTGTITFPAP